MTGVGAGVDVGSGVGVGVEVVAAVVVVVGSSLVGAGVPPAHPEKTVKTMQNVKIIASSFMFLIPLFPFTFLEFSKLITVLLILITKSTLA